MLESENLSYDVLVIGSGIAGVKAAIEVRVLGLSCLLLSKGPTGKQNSSFFAGGSLRPEPEEVKGVKGYEKGIEKYLYVPELVEMCTQQAVKEVQDLVSIGLAVEKRGREYVPAKQEEAGPGGSTLMVPLVKKAMEMGVTCLGNKSVVDLLLSEGRVKGALALDEKGKVLKISAKATIMATGGGAGIFEHNSNPEGITGDGCVLALRAGASLINMEYVHFYPVGMIGSSFPHRRCSPNILRIEGAMLVNGKGEDIVKKHLGLTLQRAIMIPTVRFEMLSRIVAEEGRNSGAFVDLTGISRKNWDAFLSAVWHKAFLDKAPVNLRTQKCAVIPVAHTFLGGVKINIKCETAIPGLFAAGEVVGGTYSGEEGANQLSRCMTLGAIAGRDVVSFVKGMKPASIKEQEWRPVLSRMETITEKKGKENPAELKKNIGRIVYASMGPIRTGSELDRGIKEMEEIDKKIGSMKVESASQLKAALDAENRLVLAKALLGTALRRKESRGPHYRSDFPHKDESWFKRVLISMDKKGQLKFGEESINKAV